MLSINNGVAKGSARSLGYIDIFKLIQDNRFYLTKFGGHKMAAGLTLEEHSIKLFGDAINLSASRFDSDDFIPLEDVIGILPSSQIDFELLEILESFEPYGEANSRPLFLIKNAKIIKIDTFGKDRSHSKIIVEDLQDNKKEIEFILFKNILEMPDDERLTCSYRAIKNEFNLKISVQLIISKIY